LIQGINLPGNQPEIIEFTHEVTLVLLGHTIHTLG